MQVLMKIMRFLVRFGIQDIREWEKLAFVDGEVSDVGDGIAGLKLFRL